MKRPLSVHRQYKPDASAQLGALLRLLARGARATEASERPSGARSSRTSKREVRPKNRTQAGKRTSSPRGAAA